jgi:hypothetical protein
MPMTSDEYRKAFKPVRGKSHPEVRPTVVSREAFEKARAEKMLKFHNERTS